MADTIRVIIKRQDAPESKPYTQEFALPYQPNLNVVSLLMEIRKNPVDAQGNAVEPVVWECDCLEEVCGACTMLINGTPRQACSALVDELKQPIRLAPLTKFPVIRDLKIDRTKLFDALKQTHSWIDIDGPFDLGPGPRFPEKRRRWAYELSRCMTCGCCYEACPQTNLDDRFMGPHAISQVRLHNAHPTGEANKEERISALLKPNGITNCGNAQNCVRVCPKDIPLTTSIAHANRDTILQALRDWKEFQV